MDSAPLRPNTDAIMKSLKDFQRATVNYAFERLYTAPDSTRRFLVADEVGLGKTMVARGLIARAIDHLAGQVRRIDVVYICSNATIAQQNMNRLSVSVPGQDGFKLATRITLLPKVVKDLDRNGINFVSFTPGTTFDLKGNLGTAEERALLYRLLKDAWGLGKETGPLNVLQGNASKERFRDLVERTIHEQEVDESLAADFAKALELKMKADREAGKPDIQARFDALAERFRYARKNGYGEEDSAERSRLVGELRGILAKVAVRALQPDLIILDEFQRFRDLLAGEDESSLLAQELFNYADEESAARVLLLSATPYKMYTQADDPAGDDHYRDFLQTIHFLQGGGRVDQALEELLKEYRMQLYRLGANDDAAAGTRLREIKTAIESRLRKVMSRTERLAATEDRNGMLVQVNSQASRLTPEDLKAFITVQKVSNELEQGDVLEYWKAAPYLLNFMDQYKLKSEFEHAGSEQQAGIAKLLAQAGNALFPYDAWRSYEQIDPGNARLRALLADTIEVGAWRLLWMPPSLPYYRLEGPYKDPALKGFTKRLVFSAWRVVPKAIASIVSYEAERCIMRSLDEAPENSPEARRRRRPLLRFDSDNGRPTAMSALGLMYPSSVLAAKLDPLELAQAMSRNSADVGQQLPVLQDVLALAEERVTKLLDGLQVETEDAALPDESWYWAAPVLLDLQHHPELTRQWFNRSNLAAIWGEEEGRRQEGGEDSHWAEHVNFARRLVEGELRLGPRPEDLALVVTQLALGGPGTATLRTFHRVTGIGEIGSHSAAAISLKDQAAQAAWAFRALFNAPDVMALLRGADRQEPYWQVILAYCIAGGLQSVLDEYGHYLVEAQGLAGKTPERIAEGVSKQIDEALGLRAVALGADRIDVDKEGRTFGLTPFRMRTRFALRYGTDKSEDDLETRDTQVTAAFNSPFWPFVLVTTSIGQEGLDFHPYCHAVVHWDLPSNPVDLEQREGRVHRYKGHAIRKNLAAKYGAQALTEVAASLNSESTIPPDPWKHMFAAAGHDKPAGASELVPYWLFPLEGGAKIERHIPALPLSRDTDRLSALRRSLALYRMVFGQPRQDDLVQYLLANLPKDQVDRMLGELQINLMPPSGADEGVLA